MGKTTKGKSEKVKIVLNYESHFKGVLYEAGEHEVDEETAKRLLQIDKILKQENS